MLNTRKTIQNKGGCVQEYVFMDQQQSDSFMMCLHLHQPIINRKKAKLLIHGATDCGIVFLSRFYPRFSDYFIIAPDLPGHGLSGGILFDVNPKDTKWTLDQCACTV